MTRDDILKAAAQVFAEKGYHAASMEDIAKVVGLKKASLYHHVDSKQEILVELLDNSLELLIERLEEETQQEMPQDQKLAAVLEAYICALTDNWELSSVLLLEHRSLDKKGLKRHVPQRDKLEAIIREIIEQGVAVGIFNSEDPRIAVKAIMGMANWLIMWFQKDGSLSAKEISKMVSDMLLSGLLIR